MKSNILLVFFALYLALTATKVEAGKGLGSIFKFGLGAKVTNGGKHYNSVALTVEQLKACLQLEEKLEFSEINISSKQHPVEKYEKKLKKIEREMSKLKTYLDLNQNTTFHTQQQVDDFNSKIERYNQFISV